MRFWGKIWQDNHLLKDMTVEYENVDTRTHLIFNALDDICREYDLAKPVWLDKNVSEFKKDAKTRFRQDNFMEEIDFDFLEFQVLEE